MEWGSENSTPLFVVRSPGNQPPSFGASKSHLIHINPVVVKRGMLGILRNPLHLYKAVSGIEDKRKYYDERCSHHSYCSGNSKGYGCREPGTMNETEIYIYLFYMFIFIFIYYKLYIYSHHSRDASASKYPMWIK